MDADKQYQKKMAVLRDKALARISKSSTDISDTVDQETRKLLHDLHVHQIELEMQNEELRQAHRELESSRDRYLELYHSAPVGYVVTDAAGMVLQANKTFGHMMDEDISTLLSKPLTRSIHTDDRAVFFARFKAFFKNPVDKRLEVRLVKKDQTVIHAKMEGHRISGVDDALSARNLSGRLLISISDITKRKTAEAAIIRAKVQWEQTFDAVPDMIAILDENAEIIRVNKALSKRLGVEPKDCIGKKCFRVLHEGQNSPPDCPHQQFLRTGRACETEGFSGKFNGHFITTVLPFNAGDQEKNWCIHISRDITDRKRAEKELLNLRNLESIGTLAGGMAHDFNNILTAIIGHIDLAMFHSQSREKRLSNLESAIDASYRARDLANRLITFAEGGNQIKQATDVRQLLEATTILTLSGANVEYDLNLSLDLYPVIADGDQIKSAVKNMISNAKEAMPWGGKLTVSARNVELEKFNGHAIAPGHYVRIDVRDEGSGIESNHLDKIFDPYFTTKQMGDQKGMGLGLAISHSIIKKHQGYISVHSRVEHGTTVSFVLPAFLTPNEPERRKNLRVGKKAPARHRVLYMDDEEMLWEVIANLLERIGCRVDFASNGDQAVSMYKKSLGNGEPYAAMILDLTIRGGAGGKEVIQKIHRIDPGAKAVVLSGYNDDPVFGDFGKYGFVGAIEKPFKAERFIKLITDILDS